jgi:cytochrome c oxidase assembly protein subunit 11
MRRDNTSLGLYALSVVIVFVGGAYGAVPLYKLFCQATGFGGTPRVAPHGTGRPPPGTHVSASSSTATTAAATPAPTPVRGGRVLRVTFNADVSDRLPWSFRPQQREVRVVPGETALVFYTAKNLTDHDVVGIAAYNVTPNKVGQYFNKIQCFCFEYQRLGAREEVDMPAFFFIDPAFADDPTMDDVDTVTLSYTFFEAR